MRYKWLWIGSAVGLMVFVSVLWLFAGTRRSVRISAPSNNARVAERVYVQGTVSPRNTTVVVVVHPLDTSGYWVQPKPTTRSDGRWKVQVYIGRPGQADIGKHFEIQAFINVITPVKEGDVLSDWPETSNRSDVIEVQRM